MLKKRRWAILLVLIALSGGILWLLFGRESMEEGRCKLVRRKADPNNPLVGFAFQMLLPQTAKPDTVRDLPAGFDRPCYYEIKSGTKRIPLVVNLSENPLLCLDAKGDGVLSQGQCFAATRIPETKVSSSSWRFGPISLVSQGGAGGIDGRFYVNVYRTDAPGPLTTFPAFFRTGRLRLAGQTYQVALADGDCDGRFNSILSLPLDHAWRLPGSDVFGIDLNHDGKFELLVQGRSEVMPLGHLVQVGGDYYALDIAPDGRSLTLSKTEPQLGTLRVECGDAAVELRLWSDAADQYLSRSHQWDLPVGKYMGICATLEEKDAAGAPWTFVSSVSSASPRLGALTFFEIKSGETTSIKIGPPFTVRTGVQAAGTGTVTIGAMLVGCGGEEYRTVPSPAFQVVDEKGMVLVADKFQYG